MGFFSHRYEGMYDLEKEKNRKCFGAGAGTRRKTKKIHTKTAGHPRAQGDRDLCSGRHSGARGRGGGELS